MAKIPEQIDKYKIEELVASGGMGAVFKAVHPTLNRPVILKKLTLRGNASITERFRREARILMDFRNDNIVDVQDHFIQGRSHYIVMEYVDGQSLKELLDEHRYLDNFTAAYIILNTAKALKYAHSRGVVHRDIKPGNILISRRGEVKLADFGIASSQDPGQEEETLTADGTTLGTPAYMAPEQFENSRTVDYRADLYSLGVMMYEMLTGLKPFPGVFSPETIRRIQKGKYKKPGRINPSAAPVLQKVIKSLIRPKPERRCSDVDTVIRRLESWIAGFNEEDVRLRLCAMVSEQPLPPVRKKRRRRTGAYIGAAIIILILSATGILYCRMTGMHRRLLSPEEYGQLGFTVEPSRSYELVLPVTEIFQDDGDEIPPMDVKIRYIKFAQGYMSLDIALPAGKYRAKTTAADQVAWTSFVIVPWREHPEPRKIYTRLPPIEPASVNISMEIHDAASGWDITGISSLEIFSKGSFHPVPGPEIHPGGVYHFRISAPGYLSQEYVLNIGKDEQVLHFQAELSPAEKDWKK